jgi:hypothetical protein
MAAAVQLRHHSTTQKLLLASSSTRENRRRRNIWQMLTCREACMHQRWGCLHRRSEGWGADQRRKRMTDVVSGLRV